MFSPLLKKLSQHVHRALSAFRTSTAAPPEDKPAQAETQDEEATGEPPGEPETSLDPRRQLEKDCYALAYREARRSWELEPVEATLKALEAKGVSRAHSIHRSASEVNDQRKLEKFKALAGERKKRVAARDRSKAADQARAQELAALGTGRPYPSISPLLRHAATLALAISIAPTLHDMFVGLDPLLKWLVGGGCAWGVSLLIIQGLVPIEADQPENHN